VPLPTHQRPCGDLFGGEQNHPEYDPAHPAGYETASTGFMMVGAREYDPEIGRFLQPDPQPTGPELQWGQLNRWAYCANDPVNASDPSGEIVHVIVAAIAMLAFLLGMLVGWWFMSNYCSKRPTFWDEVVALIVGWAVTRGAETFLAATLGALLSPVLASGSVGGAILLGASVVAVAFVAGMVTSLLLYDLLVDATPIEERRRRGPDRNAIVPAAGERQYELVDVRLV